MSLHGLVSGIAQTERKILDSAAAITLLQAGNNGNYIHSVYVAETSGTATTIILEVFDGAAGVYALTGTRSIAANGDASWQIEQRLEPGWSLRARAGAANRLHTHVTHSLQI